MKALALGLAAIALTAAAPTAQQTTGAPARDFKLTDMNGRTVQLSQFRGKPVVLEWTNAGCPFVRKHYDSGNMQRTQAAAVAGGAVWLTINSGAEGKQGYETPATARARFAQEGFKSSNYLLDHSGTVGKGYAAKTTPHIYIIDARGRLVYQGGIDDKPTADKSDVAGARNHATAALAELKAGKPVSVAETQPYGCSVKYAS